MQSYELKPETEEEILSPYEQFQLSRYGTILNNCDPDEEGGDFEYLTTPELNYIFNSQNYEK